MIHVAPGVYTKLKSIASYVQEVPSTIGCICALTDKGPDNQFLMYSSKEELINVFGKPNMPFYGRFYGQGMHCAINFLGESSSLYFQRCLPNDATFANLKISASLADADATASIVLSYVSSANTVAELKTALVSESTSYPLCILRPIGRGQYYNSISVRITEHANPMYNGVYILDIYEKQPDGDDVIVESFEVSFDPTAISAFGDSLYIEYILETYSNILRAETLLASGEYATGYDTLFKVFDKNIGVVSLVLTDGSATLTDDKQDFSDWQDTDESEVAVYMIIAKDSKGNKIYGWLGDAGGSEYDTINVFNERNLSTATRGWSGSTSLFDSDDLSISYEIKKADTSVYSAFTSSNPIPLKKGSEGTLLTANGSLDTTVAKATLVSAFQGSLTNPISGETEDSILDIDNIYFSMVFDCGYESDVKTAISTLVTTRDDCVALIDNGFNANYNAAISSRTDTHVYNNYYTALYEGYSRVYDSYIGQDIWVSPIYHMAYLAPRNDRIASLYKAIAGFNRTAIDSIKELKFNPKLGQRDQLYLKQVNPIIKLPQGYAPYSQLTTYFKAGPMQDLNVVRTYLYIKKALKEYANGFIFEDNNEFTWGDVRKEIKLFLDRVKDERGLYSYELEVSATEYEKKTKQFHVDVTLEAMRTVEKININFYMK